MDHDEEPLLELAQMKRDARDVARMECEKAYRRGVHQAIHMIDEYIHEHLEVDPASVLDIAKAEARSLRFGPHTRCFVMHEIMKKVTEQLQKLGLLEEN